MSIEQNSSLLAILDDDKSVRSALQDLIESEGLPTLGFGSAEEFLASGARQRAACLIADVRMPGMSGLELQAKLKAERCRIPIIFITGRGDIPSTVSAMKGGAIDFLTKPVDGVALLNSVATALERDRANRREAIERAKLLARYESLTPREREVLPLLVSGLLNKQAALERMRASRDRGNAAGEPFELDTRLRGKDGIYRWFLARYNPLVEEGRARRWYLSATEIESRKQEEERIRQENVRLEERTRIARELHDTLLQTFQSASLHLGAAVLRVAQDSPVKNQLDRILEIMRQGIVEGRSAIQGLRSSGSQTSDLVGALSRIQDELKVQPDIDFRVTVTGRQKQLAREIQHEIYRIGREALVNAVCHSGAKRIELELEYSDSKLYVRIRDNGCGIDPQVLEKGRDGHWGLTGMRERATRIGGLLKILSSATAGTEVELSIPSGIGLELSSSHHSSE